MDQPQVSLPYPVLSDESEIERQLRVAERYADQARDLCQRAGLQPGDRVVEIGCGPVGALLVLSQVVGPSGSVVGLDANAGALERARTILDRHGVGNVSLVQANLDTLDQRTLLGAGPFDVVFCRRFLIWQPRPVEAVRKMLPLLRPGARLIVTDPVDAPDYPVADPPVPALERGSRLLFGVIRSRGGSPDVARHYRRICGELGLEILHHRAIIDCQHAESDFGLLQQALRVSGPTLQVHGLTTEDELNQLVEALQRAQHQAFETYFGPIMAELIAQVVN